MSCPTSRDILNPVDDLIIYRVLTITSETNLPGLIHEISTSAPSYCTPLAKFWLTEDGLEDPNCNFIIITHLGPEKQTDPHTVAFHYDGGEYHGKLTRRPKEWRIEWIDDAPCYATIDGISSAGNSMIWEHLLRQK